MARIAALRVGHTPAIEGHFDRESGEWVYPLARSLELAATRSTSGQRLTQRFVSAYLRCLGVD
jgi:hypothetical protein